VSTFVHDVPPVGYVCFWKNAWTCAASATGSLGISVAFAQSMLRHGLTPSDLEPEAALKTRDLETVRGGMPNGLPAGSRPVRRFDDLPSEQPAYGPQGRGGADRFGIPRGPNYTPNVEGWGKPERHKFNPTQDVLRPGDYRLDPYYYRE
jgi:hypothetical protein